MSLFSNKLHPFKLKRTRHWVNGSSSRVKLYAQTGFLILLSIRSFARLHIHIVNNNSAWMYLTNSSCELNDTWRKCFWIVSKSRIDFSSIQKGTAYLSNERSTHISWTSILTIFSRTFTDFPWRNTCRGSGFVCKLTKYYRCILETVIIIIMLWINI